MSWAPEGNIKGPPGITQYTRQGVTPLVNGQSFIAVTFLAAMADNSWVFGGCQVLNTVDASALNIVVGTLTAKSATGFTIQLSGAPDSGNYFLQWAVAGAPTGSAATTYSLTGPTSGIVGVASSSFMVALPVGTTVAGPVTVTPHDGGAGGTFAPTTILLTTAAPSGAFTYTAASGGAKTISTTNNGALTDPATITYTASVIATTYTLTGPASGNVSVPSTNFTVALPAGQGLASPVTITPSAGGGGGTFTPTTVTLSTGSPSATFTYTPASGGVKTISTTNSGTLTDPASINYSVLITPDMIAGLRLWLKADALSLADASAVTTWPDSSGNSNDATAPGGHQPLFYNSVVGGKPVLRFNAAGPTYTSTPATAPGHVSLPQPDTIFIVVKTAAPAATGRMIDSPSADRQLFGFDASGFLQVYAGALLGDTTNHTGAFHVLCAVFNGASSFCYVDAVQVITGNLGTNALGSINIGSDNAGTAYFTGDMAEILLYNSAVSTANISALQAYFHNKYGI